MIRTSFRQLSARTSGRVWLIPLVVLALLAVSGIIVYAWTAAPADHAHVSGSGESYEGTELDGPAADFELVDQHGESVSLSDFRGKVVMLSFLDPNCTDVCPLTALHFREAYEALEPSEANAVAFLAVNVNVEANAVADVTAATDRWGMSDFPAWSFLTGDEETLREIWHTYGVEALADPEKEGEVTHTPGVFIIDPAGNQRWYVYTPLTEDFGWDGAQLGEILPEHIRQVLLDL